LLDKNILFAGYRIPHPLTNQVELRIQTDKTMEPYVTPRKALLNACIALMNQTRELKSSFIEQVRVAEMDGSSGPIAAGAGPTLTSGMGAVGNGIGAPYDETHTWGGGNSGANAAGGTIGAHGTGAPGVGGAGGTGTAWDDAYEY
jgi:DNA-directed RNA polymerase II subunit RPB11